MPDMNVASLTLPPSQSGMLIPDDVKRRILAAQLLQKQASDTTQPVYTTGLGMAKLAAGGLGGILEGWQDAQEKQAQAKSWENLANILSGKGPTPASTPAPSQSSDTPTPPANVSSNDTNPVLSALTSNSSDATPVERMAYASAAGETGVPSFANQGQIANDTGGSKSYGIFGLNTYAPNGNVADTSAGKFASNYGPQIGVTAQPGTPEFDAQWKSAAQNNPDALKAAQLDWYQKNIAGGVASKLADAGVPPAVASDPRVQTYFADRMVQQGAGSIDKHASRIAQALSASGGDPTAFLSSMSTLDRQSIPGDFRTYLSENPNNTPGLENRISKREQFALGQAPAMQAINNAMQPTQVASLDPSIGANGGDNGAGGVPTPLPRPAVPGDQAQALPSPVNVSAAPQVGGQQMAPAQAQAQASPAQMAQANPAQTAQTQMRLAQNIDPAAAMSVLKDPRVPPQMKQYLLQQINPNPNIIQMPDGTIVAVNPKTLQTTPVYRGAPKFVPNATHDQYGNPVGGFVDPNSQTVNLIGQNGQPTQQNGPAGQSASVTDLHGDDYLKTIEPGKAETVKGIAEGRIPYPSGFIMKTPYGQWLTQAVGQYEPGIDANVIAQRRKMQTDLSASSPNSIGGILSNGKSAFEHLGELSDKAVGLGSLNGYDGPGGGMAAHAGNYVGSVLGTSDTKAKIGAFNQNALKYGQESTKFYAGTGGGEAERMNALHSLNPETSSGAEQAAFLENEKSLMLDRLRQKEAQVRDVLGDNYLRQHPIMTPDLQKTIGRIDQNIAQLRGIAPATSAQPQQAQPAQGGLPPGWTVMVH